MKIIKDNRPEKRFKFPYRFTCRNCKSELEADSNDLKKMQPDPREPSDSGYFYFSCPICNSNNTVIQTSLG